MATFKLMPKESKGWFRFRDTLFSYRERNRIALMPIAITGFPDRRGFADYIRLLEDLGVGFVEIVEPIETGWAATTNETIRSAHRKALAHAELTDGPQTASRFIGSLKVLYHGDREIRTVLDEASKDAASYSIFQMAFPLPVEELRNFDAPYTSMVDATTDPEAVCRQAVDSKWMIVVKLAGKTGGELYDWESIRSSLRMIRQTTLLPVFGTFGIADARIVERLRNERLVDGVIVGTPILERLNQGLSSTRDFLADLISTTK